MSPELGRFLLVIGVLLVIVGGLAMAGIRLPFGRLPGDIAITGERGGLYIPLGNDAARLDRPEPALQPVPAPLSEASPRRAEKRSGDFRRE